MVLNLKNTYSRSYHFSRAIAIVVTFSDPGSVFCLSRGGSTILLEDLITFRDLLPFRKPDPRHEAGRHDTLTLDPVLEFASP